MMLIKRTVLQLRNEIKNILLQIEAIKKKPQDANMLPQNAYYLDDNKILCCDREKGVSRFPYDSDGLVLWAYSNGIIEALESTFNIFKPLVNFEEPTVNFFGGILNEDKEYIPISLFECTKQLVEGIKVERYVVYTNKCAYYIADTALVTFALRIHVDNKKHMHFSFNAYNKKDESVSIYMFSMFEAILRYVPNEFFWDRMTKFGNVYENGFVLRSNSNCLAIGRKTFGSKIEKEYTTVGRSDVTGNKRSVMNSECLLKGRFIQERNAVNTTDFPAAANILNIVLDAHGDIRLEYDLSYHFDIGSAVNCLNDDIDIRDIDASLEKDAKEENDALNSLKVAFKDWNGGINAELYNKFLKSVQKQVSFCAFGKNYAGRFIGVRDVMQQLESSLIWQPEKSREKIITAMNYILEDGRPPRQFSVSHNAGALPEMDLRMFIDQGVWIISTLYSYLAFTDDYTILDEKCTYFVADENNTRIIKKSDIVDTVLDHLVKIMKFLSSSIDNETGCLRILHGDWNDALDGLGRTEDAGKKYGSGVSVMASLQFYKNCEEMIEILKKTGKYTDKIEKYTAIRKNLEDGLFKYAVDLDSNGNKRIIHGWGDKLSYKIGSFSDPDGVARISSTAHSFWAVSGLIKKDLSFKETLKSAFKKLNSNYGLLTFDKPFGPELRREVGRLSGITAGTYENSASYVHASMFGIMALFAIGESEKAWTELEKSSVISHKNCSLTPFVMPNSYCYNVQYGMDGESMGDWYTGSGTVLIKSIVRYGFGISPNLDGLLLQTARTMPCNNAEISVVIKGHPIKLIYEKKGNGSRSITINGKNVNCGYDELIETPTVFIPKEKIYDNMVIKVTDK